MSTNPRHPFQPHQNLPPAWAQYFTADGRPYYVHLPTRRTQWQPPDTGPWHQPQPQPQPQSQPQPVSPSPPVQPPRQTSPSPQTYSAVRKDAAQPNVPQRQDSNDAFLRDQRAESEPFDTRRFRKDFGIDSANPYASFLAHLNMPWAVQQQLQQQQGGGGGGGEASATINNKRQPSLQQLGGDQEVSESGNPGVRQQQQQQQQGMGNTIKNLLPATQATPVAVLPPSAKRPPKPPPQQIIPDTPPSHPPTATTTPTTNGNAADKHADNTLPSVVTMSTFLSPEIPRAALRHGAGAVDTALVRAFKLTRDGVAHDATSSSNVLLYCAADAGVRTLRVVGVNGVDRFVVSLDRATGTAVVRQGGNDMGHTMSPDEKQDHVVARLEKRHQMIVVIPQHTALANTNANANANASATNENARGAIVRCPKLCVVRKSMSATANSDRPEEYDISLADAHTSKDKAQGNGQGLGQGVEKRASQPKLRTTATTTVESQPKLRQRQRAMSHQGRRFSFWFGFSRERRNKRLSQQQEQQQEQQQQPQQAQQAKQAVKEDEDQRVGQVVGSVRVKPDGTRLVSMKVAIDAALVMAIVLSSDALFDRVGVKN